MSIIDNLLSGWRSQVLLFGYLGGDVFQHGDEARLAHESRYSFFFDSGWLPSVATAKLNQVPFDLPLKVILKILHYV